LGKDLMNNFYASVQDCEPKLKGFDLER
jgi:hypothetical protein